MIQFFRKIRKSLLINGKIATYLKYAIGEIVLVVIGILIALQINNWNEKRKATIHEKSLIENLESNLESDYNRFADNIKDAKEILIAYKQLYEIGTNKKEVHHIDNPNYVRRMLKFDLNMDLDYSALSDKIANTEIRTSLLLYENEINHFEAEYLEFKTVLFLGELTLAANKPDVQPGDYYGPDGEGEIMAWPALGVIEEQALNPKLGKLLWERSMEYSGLQGNA